MPEVKLTTSLRRLTSASSCFPEDAPHPRIGPATVDRISFASLRRRQLLTLVSEGSRYPLIVLEDKLQLMRVRRGCATGKYKRCEAPGQEAVFAEDAGQHGANAASSDSRQLLRHHGQVLG